MSPFQFIFDETEVPACMKQPKFQVFGIHIYFVAPNSLHCEAVAKPLKTTPESTTTQRAPLNSLNGQKQNYITSVSHERISLNSEEYAIEAYDNYPPNRASVHVSKCVGLTILCVIINVLIKQITVIHR